MIRTLSGFLGLPSDWNFLPWPHEIYSRASARPAEDVLIGYSMGGRLALHELLSTQFRAAVIVSAGLNLDDETERATRRAADENWARRFEAEPWPQVINAWQDQPVFGGHRLERAELDYDRHELATQLRENSPGRLEPLEPRLCEIETPVLWVAGKRDAKYVEVGERAVSRLPSAELWLCPEAGHRVPWEQTERFLSRLRAFLKLH